MKLVEIFNDQWNKGFGTEAINLMLSRIGESKKYCLASINPYNKPSKRLFKKCGFVPLNISLRQSQDRFRYLEYFFKGLK